MKTLTSSPPSFPSGEANKQREREKRDREKEREERRQPSAVSAVGAQMFEEKTRRGLRCKEVFDGRLEGDGHSIELCGWAGVVAKVRGVEGKQIVPGC